MLQHFQRGVSGEMKQDGSLVTAADMEINDLVIRAVAQAFPDHSVHGEEASRIQRGSLYVWVCDPIDGTTAYTHGIPISAFSLALVKNGHPVIGVIYDPFLGRMVHAQKGGGAFLETGEGVKRVNINPTRQLQGTSLGYCAAPLKNGESLRGVETTLNDAGARLFTLRSVVYEALMVVLGEFGATIYPGHAAHDVAAAKVIVEEAGGYVTDLRGNTQRYDRPLRGALISNGVLHHQLLAIVKQHLALPSVDLEIAR